MRKLVLVSLAVVLGAFLVTLGLNAWVVLSTRAYVTPDMDKLPDNNVGLLLGTSSHTVNGHYNPHFQTRIRAAVTLYRSGKIRHLLVSGANPGRYYNEPREMYQALVKAGVPGRAITMDFAGFRTLDSVVRARAVFSQTRLTIISQRYHDYRAVFIARHKGIQASAYAARPVTLQTLIPVLAREYLARVKAVMDLFVLHTKPRFLGPPVTLEPKPEAKHPDLQHAGSEKG